MFDPGIKVGTELTNEKMRKLFKCGNMGGMRRSKETGTLVIISICILSFLLNETLSKTKKFNIKE